MNVADQIRRAVVRFGNRTAAISGSETRSYLEIDDRSNRLANALTAAGLAKGARVATLLENSIRCVEADFGLAKAGLVRVSLNPMSNSRDVIYMLEDSGAEAFIFDEKYSAVISEVMKAVTRPVRWIMVQAKEGSGAALALPQPDRYEDMLAAANAAPHVCPCDGEDLYCLFYTSGTTGRPKGVMLSHRAILQVGFNLVMEVGPHAPGEKVLLMQPMSHGAGFFVLPWFIKGGISVIMPQFDAEEALRLARDLEIETIKLIPTMMQRILNGSSEITGQDLPMLRQIIYGASPMPIEVLRNGINRFGPVFIQIYGQSEAPVTISILPIEDHELDGKGAARLASAGAAWPTVQLRIVDANNVEVPAGTPGEVLVRAPQMMSGYWKRPDLTEAALVDGWLHTKDLGRMDEKGFLYLLGRLDEMIISGGYNIAPREVEDVLYQHPAVREAAVVGEADAEWGAAVVAYVVLNAAVEEAEIRDFVKTEIGFKRPKRVYRVAELPKNSNGKIQKSALKPELALPWEGAVQ